ncbi:Glutamate 5-kinase / RNA-binding C-terminal domain PUA [hydrothermal vent metagenome]|uniref:Glutamate 5-kinase / RNA-binding C-terminal domain PUA n=1 Tax=hydrothermal vent metagenome TaxID=652676 RepID=A0A3B1A4G9_9ZZZZ
MKQREKIKTTKRWVVKIGSALLTNDGAGLNHVGISSWVTQIVALKKLGIDVVLVSSGAVAEGMSRIGLTERPVELHDLQAAAAIGQMGLIQSYESQFQKYDLHTAQVLLTHDDLSNRKRYLNARNTLNTLLTFNVIPVVNENDTVVTDEIRFGDNDTLAALVANLIEADLLVLLTDQQGLFDKDPRHTTDATLIAESNIDNTELDSMVQGESGNLGRGGMLTKLRAARLAARSACTTVIAAGSEADMLQQIQQGQVVGTLLYTNKEPESAKKQWLAGHLQTCGVLTLDDGAVKVLKESGKSLLAIGVNKVVGKFVRGDMVVCIDMTGTEVARGLVNYNADETIKIMSEPSYKIETLLGYVGEPELINRDNLVLS